MDPTGGDLDPNTTTIGDLSTHETLADTRPNVQTAGQQPGTASASTLDALSRSSSP